MTLCLPAAIQTVHSGAIGRTIHNQAGCWRQSSLPVSAEKRGPGRRFHGWETPKVTKVCRFLISLHLRTRGNGESGGQGVRGGGRQSRQNLMEKPHKTNRAHRGPLWAPSHYQLLTSFTLLWSAVWGLDWHLGLQAPCAFLQGLVSPGAVFRQLCGYCHLAFQIVQWGGSGLVARWFMQAGSCCLCGPWFLFSSKS